ncbi:hypothetical protein F2Q70_00038499 [Brassica cretica]|uniref:Uncharacterized protein n=1 Tax=Brassica cretica TaxID=69181 RepID=A0A8S9MHA3_BRACR|nr:hypothetical protein F2Q70_00038499 [Brassica cretica]KAF2616473.1 hypothetical protein F2Q68_00039130 [Brassica cretica]
MVAGQKRSQSVKERFRKEKHFTQFGYDNETFRGIGELYENGRVHRVGDPYGRGFYFGIHEAPSASRYNNPDGYYTTV